MPTPDLITLFVAPLNRAGFVYMVTGAVAAIVYGEPRLTNDIDIVLGMAAAEAEWLRAAFDNSDFYVPPADVIAIEAGRALHGHFNLIHTASALKADIYPAGADPLHAWALAKRQSVNVAGESVWIAPPEYVILRKLQYLRDGGSEKHVGDIRAILRLQPEMRDAPALLTYVNQYSLDQEWGRARG